MKPRAWLALARGVVLEALRRKDLWVIAVLGFLIMLGAGALGFFGSKGLEIFVKDLATTVLGVFSTVVAVVTSSRMLPEEIQRRTLYPLLSRPISRFDLLVGKFLGSVLVSWIAFLMLASVTAIALLAFHISFEFVMVQYLIAKMMGLAVLCAVTMALSVIMTPSGAATLSLVLAFGSTLIIRGMTMGYEGASAPVQAAFKILNAIVPQYSLFDFGGRAANIGWPAVPSWVVWALLAYALLYCGAMVTLSWVKFRRRAL